VTILSNQKEHFLAEVLLYIKSNEAKEIVYKELSYHLKMSKLELVSKGTSEKEAEEKAIKLMGNPTELGTHFNKLYRPSFDWKLFSLFIIIISMGILPIVNMQNLMMNQIIYIVLGIIVTINMMLIDYRKMKKLGWLFLIAAIGLLFALNFAPNIIINGVGYLRIAGFTISGGTLFPLFLIFWAFYLSKEKPKLIIVLSVYLLSVFLFMGLPSLSEVLIYTILVLTLFFFSNMNKKVIFTTIGLSFSLILTLTFIFWLTAKEYQKGRLHAFLHPRDYADNGGYMYVLLKDLLSKGGWFGNHKLPEKLPVMTTDMAFANITYFYGWILSGFLFALVLLLLFRLIVVSAQIKDRFGKQLILGVCSLLSIQFVYNVGMIFGFLPITSMSLPFISYGLTPTVLNSLLIGIVLSVYRRKHLVVNL
jgi:cell division protein FtsW (lipid II flippase)